MESLLKIYAWGSGLVVASCASYLTAVLAAAVPAPKDLLCTMSLGFCLPPKVIEFGATDIDRIVDRDGVGQGPGEHQIGMLHNKVEPNRERPNMVKYKIATDVPGNFQLKILYASSTPTRPVELYVNDAKVASNALAESTGGWDNKDRKWSEEHKVILNAGDNTLMIKRSSIFPHLSKLRFTQVK